MIVSTIGMGLRCVGQYPIFQVKSKFGKYMREGLLDPLRVFLV